MYWRVSSEGLTKGLDRVSCEERLGELGQFSLESTERVSHQCTEREDVKGMEPGSF